MSHSLEHATRWLELAVRQDLPLGGRFAEHMAAGTLGALCTCGCHGFGYEIPAGVELQPLAKSAGLFCELAFESNLEEEINILLFTDSRGYFAGADVTYGQANIDPMPDSAEARRLVGCWPSDNVAGA